MGSVTYKVFDEALEEVAVTYVIDTFFANHVRNVVRTESRKTVSLDEQTSRLLHGILGMVDEVGELAKQLKAHIYYGKALDLVNIGEEIGDASWYQTIIVDAAGLQMRDILEKNIAKLRARYPEKFTEEAALNRDLEKERKVLEGNDAGTSTAGG